MRRVGVRRAAAALPASRTRTRFSSPPDPPTTPRLFSHNMSKALGLNAFAMGALFLASFTLCSSVASFGEHRCLRANAAAAALRPLYGACSAVLPAGATPVLGAAGGLAQVACAGFPSQPFWVAATGGSPADACGTGVACYDAAGLACAPGAAGCPCQVLTPCAVPASGAPPQCPACPALPCVVCPPAVAGAAAAAAAAHAPPVTPAAAAPEAAPAAAAAPASAAPSARRLLLASTDVTAPAAAGGRVAAAAHSRAAHAAEQLALCMAPVRRGIAPPASCVFASPVRSSRPHARRAIAPVRGAGLAGGARGAPFHRVCRLAAAPHSRSVQHRRLALRRPCARPRAPGSPPHHARMPRTVRHPRRRRPALTGGAHACRSQC
jgi:hypothetical protein